MKSHKHNAGSSPTGAAIWPMLGSVMKALANPLRLRILDALTVTEHSVGDLASGLGIERSLVSQHLNVLRHAGLVESERVRHNVIARPTQSAMNLGRCCDKLAACIHAKTPCEMKKD
jgi:DNA-binding MarR family transcriptional regulator